MASNDRPRFRRPLARHIMSGIAVLVSLAQMTAGVERDWRWLPDEQLNQIRHGARGMWNDMLWGFDFTNNRTWVYDEVNGFRDAGAMPGNQSPRISLFNDDGIYVLASHRQGDIITAEILHSPDGFQDYQVMLSSDSTTNGVPFASGHEHSLVDLGQGRLMYFEYSDESRVYYTDTAGREWEELFRPELKSIRHYHGAMYDPEYGKLYIMAGDSNSQASIMVADDIFGPNGLVNDPGLWRTRWGLDDVNRSTLDADYFLKPRGLVTSQSSRAVDMEIDGDYVYWGEDAGNENGLSMFRVHRETSVVEEVGDTKMIGAPWRILPTDDGELLVLTARLRIAGKSLPGMDEFVHIYGFNEDRSDYSELARFPVHKNAVSGSTAYGFVEAFGRLWINGYNITQKNLDLVGTLAEVVLGDYDEDEILTVADIDLLTNAVQSGSTLPIFDLDLDGQVDQQDRIVWVETLRGTSFGDANFDGRFDSSDLVGVLAAGEYEDGISRNSRWDTGDWDGDADFTSGDLVWALQRGTYDPPAGRPVPEPSFLLGWPVVLLAHKMRVKRKVLNS